MTVPSGSMPRPPAPTTSGEDRVAIDLPLVARRLVARAIDWFIASAIVLVGWFIAATTITSLTIADALVGTTSSNASASIRAALVLIAFVVPLIWELVWLATVGATPGKLMLHLRVVPMSESIGRGLPLLSAAFRSSVNAYLGFVMVDGGDAVQFTFLCVYLVGIAASGGTRGLLDVAAGSETEAVLRARIRAVDSLLAGARAGLGNYSEIGLLEADLRRSRGLLSEASKAN